ncbi:hypothetical protein [Amycolatopsis sp. NPDC059657]|uniref:hypothetical protein n=1 Tax=Amycolatopsis sp. NPDC059657 TaxID=3346899 RepID=UPI00366EF7D9
MQRSSQHFKAWPLDTVIAELTRGQPYRHVMGYELGESRRADRDARYNTALRTGEYPLREWGWDRARTQRFLQDTFGVQAWVKSACVYCLLSALLPCLDRSPCGWPCPVTVLQCRLSRMYALCVELIFFS